MRAFAVICVLVLLGGCGTKAIGSQAGQVSARSDATAAVIDHYRREIPQLMEDQGVPGLAIAVVDDQGVVWSEAFGVAHSHESEAVTPDTMFSLQSTSKTFTATAILLAVQEGLLDLDEPIITYLPNFTVQSIFEDHPESRITMRHLLSHTAGFTIEAPVGNNWDGNADSFDAHIASISETWLRFPVGTGYAYSNLGIDLAGYILQQVTDQPFADYTRAELFELLGMLDSSFDADVIGSATDVAVGHESPLPHEFRPVPMVPSGDPAKRSQACFTESAGPFRRPTFHLCSPRGARREPSRAVLSVGLPAIADTQCRDYRRRYSAGLDLRWLAIH